MTRADGDLFVPTILRSILIIIFKEKALSSRRKLILEGVFISMGK